MTCVIYMEWRKLKRLVCPLQLLCLTTIGDAYVAVAGLTYNPDHAQAVVDMALEMLQAKVLTTNSLGVRLRLRIGIASGPVIAGVIGIHKWCYDLYGDTVTEAAYMESHSAPSRILVANSTYEKLPKDHYKFEERVPVNADESQHLGKSQFVVSRSKSGTLNPFGSDGNHYSFSRLIYISLNKWKSSS